MMLPTLALLWHLALLSLLLCFCVGTGGTNTICREGERNALLRMKQSFIDDSNRLSSWKGFECCTWVGVGCDNITGHVVKLDLSRFDLSGVLSDSILALDQISHLDLSSNYFGGSRIPKFLSSLTNLRYLNLFDCGFSGEVRLGNLTGLRYLNLGSSLSNGDLQFRDLNWVYSLSQLRFLNLNGVLFIMEFYLMKVINMLPFLRELHMSNCALKILYPLSRANFTSLVTLDLSWNYFVSPDFKWFSNLNSLQFLDLSFNDFTGPIPFTFHNLTSLTHLDLSSNKLNSTVPEWMYDLTKLNRLYLASNQLEGGISSSISNLSSLVELDLSENGFGGEVPTSMTNLCSLREFDFSSNNLSGGVSGLLGRPSACITRTLESVNLANNDLSGPLPDQVGKFEHLTILSAANNSFSGPVPEALGSLSNLKVLQLSINKMTGNLPESLGHLANLEQLDVSYNLLQGVVSEKHFSALTNLKTFTASGNNLTLRVNSNWIPPFQLEKLTMRSWDLGSQFPAWLESQKACWYVDLSDAGISGVIPPWFWNLSQIQHFNFSHNNFHGEIPELPYGSGIYLSSNSFTGAVPRIRPDIVDLDLSNNAFEGSLSPILCGQVMSLWFLDLLQNCFAGKIPNCWKNWSLLMVLRLGNNNLSGKIPTSVGFLLELQSLHLRNNSLSGTIPLFMSKCRKLKIIDLSENKFSGTIPGWMGKSLASLIVLALRSNEFNGTIPSNICHLKFLQILDLADNRISGAIPNCIGNFSAMAKQQLKSSGRIGYEFPGYQVLETASLVMKGMEYEYSNTLALVTSIDLSRNNISGVLPEQIGSLYGLLSLNLSRNHLRGNIPDGISYMRSLESLDLSMNQFSGVIPQSMANLTFLGHLNLSCNDFTGKIPSGTQIQSFDARSFLDNPHLCGKPLPKKCIDDGIPGITPKRTPSQNTKDGKGDEWIEMKWFYMSIPLGFALSFSGFWSSLIFVDSWRRAYYQFLDDLIYNILRQRQQRRRRRRQRR